MPNEPVTVEQWRNEAIALFGPDPRAWTFRCPVCGNLQTLLDFEHLGADPQSAYQECIGRHMEKRATDFATVAYDGDRRMPCDYAAYGLLAANGVRFVIPEEGGKPIKVFPFSIPSIPKGAANAFA